MNNDYKQAMLLIGSPIMEAIRVIDKAAMQIALVVDNNDKLLGTVTDGDIRRGILDGVSLENPVDKIMNSNPFTVTASSSCEEMLKIMMENRIHQLPVTDSSGCVVGIVKLDELVEKEASQSEADNSDDIRVVLMLGGLGSRLLPLTEEVPKPMIKIGGKPLLETIVGNFASQGFKNFYFSVNYKSDVIKNHFKDGSDFGVNICYLDEDKRMGTAGALSLLPDTPKAPLIVMNGDILTDINFSNLVNFHVQNNAAATMCVREYHQQVPYGVVKASGTKLKSIVEKPSQTYFVNAGIYVVNPDVLNYVPSGNYFDMPDLFDSLEKAGKDSAVFPIREYWLDIGNLADLERGHIDYDRVFNLGAEE